MEKHVFSKEKNLFLDARFLGVSDDSIRHDLDKRSESGYGEDQEKEPSSWYEIVERDRSERCPDTDAPVAYEELVDRPLEWMRRVRKIFPDKARDLVIHDEAYEAMRRQDDQGKIKQIDIMRQISRKDPNEHQKGHYKEECEGNIPEIFPGFDKRATHRKKRETKLLVHT